MTLYQFKLLNTQEQVDLIEKFAIFLAARVDGVHRYKLLQLDSFYIEEEWQIIFNERRRFTAFIATERLQPYLQMIDLSSLGIPKRNDY